MFQKLKEIVLTNNHLLLSTSQKLKTSNVINIYIGFPSSCFRCIPQKVNQFHNIQGKKKRRYSSAAPPHVNVCKAEWYLLQSYKYIGIYWPEEHKKIVSFSSYLSPKQPSLSSQMQTCSSSLLPSVSSPKNVQLDANTPDKIVWKWTVNGEYSAWLIIKNRVWTSDRLAARGWPRNEVCPLCRQVLETAHHQLFPFLMKNVLRHGR